MADRDKVDPADEPDTSATPDEPVDAAPDVDDVRADDDASKGHEVESAGRSGRAKKDKATPKQTRDAAEHHRTGPVTFVHQSVAELRKVVYPTGPQLANYFVVVLIFVLFVIAYVSLLDLGIGAVIFRVFA
ncbi:MAG TPA: preprotein translocase subunit SecE [Microlunatus sp.]|nr:preprotein translocase subunit SecE [Microlunatus sp.]